MVFVLTFPCLSWWKLGHKLSGVAGNRTDTQILRSIIRFSGPVTERILKAACATLCLPSWLASCAVYTTPLGRERSTHPRNDRLLSTAHLHSAEWTLPEKSVAATIAVRIL